MVCTFCMSVFIIWPAAISLVTRFSFRTSSPLCGTDQPPSSFTVTQLKYTGLLGQNSVDKTDNGVISELHVILPGRRKENDKRKTMNESNQLSAGAAMIDITPPAGTHLAGSGAGDHRPVQAVLDPLFAKAIVFEAGGRRVCLVILDLTIVTGEYTDRIRANICEQTGIERDAIMVQATQTHSAPSLGYFMLDPDFPLETSEETEYLRGGRARLWRPCRSRCIRGRGRSGGQAATRAHRSGPRRVG